MAGLLVTSKERISVNSEVPLVTGYKRSMGNLITFRKPLAASLGNVKQPIATINTKTNLVRSQANVLTKVLVDDKLLPHPGLIDLK